MKTSELTLRDRLAAEMAAQIIASDWGCVQKDEFETVHEASARHAYALSDAMIIEREKELKS